MLLSLNIIKKEIKSKGQYFAITMIKFSIHVPVYNSAMYLDKCIQSILCQTYSNFELLLVDDFSTDGSSDICDKYANLDERVRIFHLDKNIGTLAANRYSLRRMTGDWCAFCDCDDIVIPTWLEKIKNYSEKYNADMVMFDYVEMFDESQLKKMNDVSKKQVKLFDKNNKQELFRDYFKHELPWPLWGKSFKSEIIDRFDDYEKFGRINQTQDAIQSMAPLLNSKRAVFVPDILYYFRQNSKSISHTNSMEKIHAYDSFINSAIDFDRKHGQTKSTHDAIAYCVIGIYRDMVTCMIQCNTKKPIRRKNIQEICKSSFWSEYKKSLNISSIGIKRWIAAVLFEMKQVLVLDFIFCVFSKKIERAKKLNSCNY